MNAEEKLLKVLSDHFEAATGRAVDMSAWSLDSLVRVLSSPNEVAALLGAFGSSRPAGVAAVEQQARYVVIGPPCRQPAKPFDFSALELRVAGRLIGQPTTLIGLPEDIPPGSYEARIEGTVVSPDAGDVRGTDLVEVMAQLFVYTRDAIRPDPLTLLAPLDHGRSLHDALSWFAHLPPVMPRGAQLFSLLHDEAIFDVPARCMIVPIKDKRFNQRHEPKQPRNPMPAASPFKRARR